MTESVKKYMKYLTACAGSGNRNQLRFDWWYHNQFYIKILGEISEIDYHDLRLVIALEAAAREYRGVDLLYQGYYGQYGPF